MNVLKYLQEVIMSDKEIKSFNDELKDLYKSYKASKLEVGSEIALVHKNGQKLMARFRRLQNTFHKELFDFHHTELCLSRSNIQVDEKLPTIRENSFYQLVEEFKEAIINGSELSKTIDSFDAEGNLVSKSRNYVEILKEMFESLVHHLSACTQYSFCTHNLGRSQEY